MVLLAGLPQVEDLLCHLCTSGHSDLVFILPDLTVAEIENARDKLYLFGDTSDLQEIFQFKSSDDSHPINELEQKSELVDGKI